MKKAVTTKKTEAASRTRAAFGNSVFMTLLMKIDANPNKTERERKWKMGRRGC